MKLLVNLDVPNLEDALHFYVEGLGLRVGRKFDERFVELLGAGSPIYLLQNNAGTKAVPALEIERNYSRHWTPVHLDFAVENLEATIEKILKLGATQEKGISTEPYGRLSTFADPFGHGFCLIEFNSEGYDALLK